jgi:nucleoside 2-deoxyribosyltransferase
MRTSLPSPPRVYLAGPDVFFPEALSIARGRIAFLAEIGIIGVFPLDSQGAQFPSRPSAATIFRTNCELIDSCQGVLANLSPFRGPSADVGTAWELGYACGRQKPVSAYSDDLSAYRHKVFTGGWSEDPQAPSDKNGNEIENFGEIDNLMLTQSVLAVSGSFEESARKLQRILSQGPST